LSPQAKAIDWLGYRAADFTCALSSPAGWGRRVAEAVSRHRADCVVATEFRGAMVGSCSPPHNAARG